MTLKLFGTRSLHFPEFSIENLNMEKILQVVVLWSLLFFNVLLVQGAGTLSDPTTTTEIIPQASPCPCTGQPAGTVISHPSDCRAYYTCVTDNHVLHSRCDKVGDFFHLYIRSCVGRSTLASFVPDFIPTKDICKITAVFPAPAMEDLNNCTIENGAATSTDSDSDENYSRKMSETTMSSTTSSPLGGLDNILQLFPWVSNRDSASNPKGMMNQATGNPQLTPQNLFQTTIKPTSPEGKSCKLAGVVIHHYPGPCKAEITCESGFKFTIDKCQSSLSLMQI